MNYIRAGILLCLILLAHTVDAILPREFDDPKERVRYEQLIESMRCLVCQNETLSESNAELAEDLRREVYEMVIAGHDDEQIREFLVSRYGDFVLYRPPVKGSTYLLWFGPGALLLLGVIALLMTVRRQSGAEVTALSDSERELANKILSDSDENN
ncbi:MAG: cytochrome c-type biogenesis protein [Pseudomonadota bacterium]|nr:cytochrome c-type biogenesis protein [Pseudomonadota bacterium]